jgi:hypothetical protein
MKLNSEALRSVEASWYATWSELHSINIISFHEILVTKFLVRRRTLEVFGILTHFGA